jgi:hypothetical protein
MVPTNPLRLPRVIVDVPEPPAVKLIWVCEADIEKSGVEGEAGPARVVGAAVADTPTMH